MDQRITPIYRAIARGLAVATVGLMLTLGTQAASAETLMRPDINHAKPGSHYYVRGLSMSQVAQKFGPPAKKLRPIPARGTKYQPPITQWVYPDFTVYFAHGRAIHLVKVHPRP